jgi:hypothetical protein
VAQIEPGEFAEIGGPHTAVKSEESCGRDYDRDEVLPPARCPNKRTSYSARGCCSRHQRPVKVEGISTLSSRSAGGSCWRWRGVVVVAPDSSACCRSAAFPPGREVDLYGGERPADSSLRVTVAVGHERTSGYEGAGREGMATGGSDLREQGGRAITGRSAAPGAGAPVVPVRSGPLCTDSGRKGKRRSTSHEIQRPVRRLERRTSILKIRAGGPSPHHLARLTILLPHGFTSKLRQARGEFHCMHLLARASARRQVFGAGGRGRWSATRDGL